MLDRYLLAAYVSGRGWHQHPARKRFFMRSTAITFALLDSGRRELRGFLDDPEWHPVPMHGRVRDNPESGWVAARNLPLWLP